MKAFRIATSGKSLLVAAMFISSACFGQLDRSQAPKPGPAREIKIGDYQTFTLKNGLQVFVVENHKLPRIQFSLQLKNDPILEKDKVGYVSTAGELMGRGTTSRTKAQLDEEVDFIGAALNTSSGGVFASSLSKHTGKLLELMTDVLFRPSFSADELDKIKTQTLSSLAAGKDDPEYILDNVSHVLKYGKDHPYGELEREETINAMTLEDCKNYHATYFKPNNAYLAIVGDIDLKTAKKLVNKYFGKWQKGNIPAASYAVPQQPSKTYVALVDRPASVQSDISICYPINLKPGSADAMRLGIANNILGGSGLTARLNKNLREDKAFTYGVGSSISSDKLVGSFETGGSVRNEVTDSAVYEFLYELKKMSSEPVTEEELNAAKAYLSGSFGRSLESPQTVASFAVNTARYNLPKDYYSNYLKNLNAITSEEILASCKAFIKPDNAYIVVVGKSADIAKGLKKFGEIKYYTVYGDPTEAPKTSSIPPGLTADKVISDYLSAIGGLEKINKLKSMKVKLSGSVQGAQLTITDLWKAPNKKLTEVHVNGAMLYQRLVSDGKDISITQMGQKPPMDEKTKEERMVGCYWIPETVLDITKTKVTLKGVESIEDAEAYVVEFELPLGGKSTEYYDTQTGLKVRTTQELETPQGTFLQTTDYSDYKEYGGILMPTVISQTAGPQVIKFVADSVEPNVDVADSLFVVE